MKWIGLGFVLEVELVGLVDGLVVRGEWKRGIKNDRMIFRFWV